MTNDDLRFARRKKLYLITSNLMGIGCYRIIDNSNQLSFETKIFPEMNAFLWIYVAVKEIDRGFSQTLVH